MQDLVKLNAKKRAVGVISLLVGIVSIFMGGITIAQEPDVSAGWAITTGFFMMAAILGCIEYRTMDLKIELLMLGNIVSQQKNEA